MNPTVYELTKLAYTIGYKSRLKGLGQNCYSFIPKVFRRNYIDGWVAADKVVMKLLEQRRRAA